MARVKEAFPYLLNDRGTGYVCGFCGEPLPDGVQVLGVWDAKGNLTGVTAQNLDADVVHDCGAVIEKGKGQTNG